MERTDWERLKELPPLGAIGAIALLWVVSITELWIIWNWVGVPLGVTLPVGWWDMNWVWLFAGCVGALGKLVKGVMLKSGLQGAPKKADSPRAPPAPTEGP